MCVPLSRSRRERAKRFGVATEADRAAAALAAEALADDWTSDEAQWADAVTREHVIHLRSPRYLAVRPH